ncbi:putative fungal protein [Erysiphe necator]|uniref:Putative fungal protein n=1 Tax=Uncinula necator TaxID=52586 RepID=A0A0B1P3N3_UNCNE|nr:putative fungal protein [Erysiphe necator]
MPPFRTPASRAGRSERTHEENVERAFIAASRRCDRSLEARVESARRASEIHKARTGRGLKITEKDVQNEEMYEEEDDDLPLQYRRLTAGFQTSSPEFNRRFAAYLTTHVAIRTALEQSILQSYQQQAQQEQQQYGINPNLSQHQLFERFPSPLLAHQAQQAQQAQRAMLPAQGSPISRYSPYTIPSRPGLATSLSQGQISSPLSKVIPPVNTDSRISDLSSEVPQIVSLPSTPIQTSNEGPLPSSPAPGPSFASCSNQHTFKQQHTEIPQNQLNTANPSDLTTLGPLSTALPPETQSFLGHNMGLSDPTCNMYDAINNTKLNYLNTQVKTDTKSNSCGLDMTLIPDINIQENPYAFANSNFDELQPTESVILTPSSGMNEENDWRTFIDRSDSWPFSE